MDDFGHILLQAMAKEMPQTITVGGNKFDIEIETPDFEKKIFLTASVPCLYLSAILGTTKQNNDITISLAFTLDGQCWERQSGSFDYTRAREFIDKAIRTLNRGYEKAYAHSSGDLLQAFWRMACFL